MRTKMRLALVIATVGMGHARAARADYHSGGVRGAGGPSQYPATKPPPGYSFVRIHYGELQTQPMWGVRAPSGGIYNGIAAAQEGQRLHEKRAAQEAALLRAKLLMR